MNAGALDSCLKLDDSDEKTSWKFVDDEVVDENFEIFSFDVIDEAVDATTGISGGVKIPKNKDVESEMRKMNKKKYKVKALIKSYSKIG